MHSTGRKKLTVDTEKEPQVNTHCSDISASLAADPEHGEMTLIVKVKNFGVIDGADSESSFHWTHTH